MSTLVHITPQLPPAIDGVGDYCWNLWKNWPEPERDWQFLVARGAQATSEALPELKLTAFELNAASLANALEQTGCSTVVLHYVGYAYQPKGIPLWLPRALAQWRVAALTHHAPCTTERRLIVMFHEMYARSSPSRSPFWVAPFARHIIRRLIRLSHVWMTSCDRYFNQLVREFGAVAEHGRIVPIASNIPAPAALSAAPAAARKRIVIFGLAKTRVWALERHWRLLRELHRAGLLEHVTLLGKAPERADVRAWRWWALRIGHGVNWRQQFDLSPQEISDELAQHDLGLLANEPDILTKSGAFAALATHGVVPVISVRGDSALPVALRGAAFVNDDRGTIPRLLELLRDAATCDARGEKLLGFARRELEWAGIAQSWTEVLQRAAGLQPAECALEVERSILSRAFVVFSPRRLQAGGALTGAATRPGKVEASA